MYLSFIEIFELLKNNKHIMSSENYNIYFNYRSKRLCVTLMLLCDLAFTNEVVNSEKIREYLLIGQYSEIKATIIRDFTKRNTSDSDNSYLAFKNLKENSNKSEDEIENLFKNMANADLERLMNEKVSKEVIDVIENFFAKYYSKSGLNLKENTKIIDSKLSKF